MHRSPFGFGTCRSFGNREMVENQQLLNLARQLTNVRGVAGVALSGSPARGDHPPDLGVHSSHFVWVSPPSATVSRWNSRLMTAGSRASSN